MLAASGVLGPTVAVAGSNSTTQAHTTITANLTDGITISPNVGSRQTFVWDQFSTLVITLCFPIGMGTFVALFVGLAGPMRRPIGFSLKVAVLAAVLVVLAIVMVLGPASQMLIPSIRSWASGSWEMAVLLVMLMSICLAALVLTLRRTPGRMDKQKTGVKFEVAAHVERINEQMREIRVGLGPEQFRTREARFALARSRT
jgi:hypothetical protein